jgi:UDP-N-acetylmuramyl tripeptide synthase
MLVTNLFRDQLTRNGNVDVIISKLTEAIKPKTKLILNANDPISSLLAPDNERVYYCMDKTNESSPVPLNITHDAKVCPKCFGKMKYEFFHYNHIGKFECENCGYKNQTPKYVASEVDFESGDFLINGTRVNTQYKSAFNFLNVTAAVALCTEAGLDISVACENASSFVVMKQRFDEFELGNRKAVMILSKNQNPVSFDQSISYVLSDEGEKTVIVFVNNINHTHNKDTTWLYDISFERLNGKISSIICTGPRAYDLAVRLKLADFDMQCVLVEPELEKLKKVCDKTNGTVYILTELYDARAILNAISEKSGGNNNE